MNQSLSLCRNEMFVKKFRIGLRNTEEQTWYGTPDRHFAACNGQIFVACNGAEKWITEWKAEGNWYSAPHLVLYFCSISFTSLSILQSLVKWPLNKIHFHTICCPFWSSPFTCVVASTTWWTLSTWMVPESVQSNIQLAKFQPTLLTSPSVNVQNYDLCYMTCLLQSFVPSTK